MSHLSIEFHSQLFHSVATFNAADSIPFESNFICEHFISKTCANRLLWLLFWSLQWIKMPLATTTCPLSMFIDLWLWLHFYDTTQWFNDFFLDKFIRADEIASHIVIILCLVAINQFISYLERVNLELSCNAIFYSLNCFNTLNGICAQHTQY